MLRSVESGNRQNQQKSGASPAASSLPGRQATLPESRLVRLQAMHGNQGVQRLLRGGGILQRKLTINQPGDAFEQEADRVAEKVMRMPDPAATREPVATSSMGARLQRCACGKSARTGTQCEECKSQAMQLQRIPAASAGDTTAPPIVHDVLKSPGRSLDAGTRNFMENRFRHDFSQVRIHTDSHAAESAKAVNALAYTVGRDIVFAQGSTGSAPGQHLLAHELTHTIQQGEGHPLSLQRQSIDDIPGPITGPPSPAPAGPAATPTVPINEPPEPGCPGGGTNLGSLNPDPPCADSDEIIEGIHFKFCRDSDIFAVPSDRQTVRDFAQIQASRATFKIQAWASMEGPGTPAAAQQYNLNLSCHRAKRVARELVNAGVREERISVVAKGPTDRFDAGTTEAHRANNRIVVLAAEAPSTSGEALASNATLSQVARAAKQSIERGEYFLGADAYVSRWTCGQFRSLSDIVQRVTVLAEGEDFPAGHLSSTSDPSTGLSFSEGDAPLTGLNTVRLSRDILLTDSPLGCAENRIADLAFHHFVRPQIPAFREQHEGALHMLALGGFDPCRVSLPPLTHSDFDVPQQNDPKQGLAPPCAERPLPGAITPQRQTGPAVARPTFTGSLTVTQSSGALTLNAPQFVLPSGLAFNALESPPGTITVDADVTASGDPREIQKYDVGFVQTAASENRFVTYVGGQRIRWQLPLPMRDGPPASHPASDPPWFTRQAHVRAQSGASHLQMRDSPGFGQYPARFVDLSSTRFARRRGSPGSFEDRPTFVPSFNSINPARDAQRSLQLSTWLVVRRNTPPAPVSSFSTEFLSGANITFAARGNLLTQMQSGVETDTGSGTWRVNSTVADPSDASTVQFHGATPADFFPRGQPPLFNEFLTQEGAAPRLQASGGMDISSYRQQLLTIAAGPRTTRGLRQQLRAEVRIDLSTGRVQLDDLNVSHNTIRISTADGSSAPADQLQGLARDIFPEVRRLVLGHDAAIRDDNNTQFTVPFILDRIP